MTPDISVSIYFIVDNILKFYGHQSHKLAKVTDAEVITVAAVAALAFNNNHERALHWMQAANEIKKEIGVSRFNRRIHKLMEPMGWILEMVGELLGGGEVFVIDSMPVPCCRYYRRLWCKKVKGKAYYGNCSAKKEKFYGYRLHLVCNEAGCPINFMILPASVHDIKAVEELVSDLPFGSSVGGDKGYISAKMEGKILAKYGVRLVTSRRKNMRPNCPEDDQFIRKYRKRIETLFSKLEKMGVQRIHARTIEGLMIKVRAALIAVACTFI